MAPRQPADDASSTSTIETALKPKTKKAKVEKAKADKAEKSTSAKAEKGEKAKPAAKSKTEKVEKMEKVEKESRVKEAKDGKARVKAVTGDEAIELILVYLKAQNRPYSATEVSANLHGKVTKTVADKTLKEMENNGQIMGKSTKGKDKDGKDIAGSQWVFWCKQDPADAASPEELAAMDETITALRAAIPCKKSNLKALKTKLDMIMAAPTTEELVGLIEKLKGENEGKKERLKGCKEGSVRQVSREEVEKAEREFRYWGLKRRVRKEAFLALEGMLLDGMTKEEIWERAGIEGDEE